MCHSFGLCRKYSTPYPSLPSAYCMQHPPIYYHSWINHRHPIPSKPLPCRLQKPRPPKMYRAALALRPMARSAIMRAAPAPIARLAQPIAIRSYAAAAGLSKDQISERVLEVMKTFEKVDGGKVGLLVLGFVLGGVLC